METTKKEQGSLQILLRGYLRLLKEKPIITKSLTRYVDVPLSCLVLFCTYSNGYSYDYERNDEWAGGLCAISQQCRRKSDQRSGAGRWAWEIATREWYSEHSSESSERNPDIARNQRFCQELVYRASCILDQLQEVFI